MQVGRRKRSWAGAEGGCVSREAHTGPYTERGVYVQNLSCRGGRVEGQQDEAHAERIHLMLCQHNTHHTHVDTPHTRHFPHLTSRTPHPPRLTVARTPGGGEAGGGLRGTRARAKGAEGGLKVLGLLPVCLQRSLQLHSIPLRMPQAAFQAQVEEVVPREFSYPLFQSCLDHTICTCTCPRISDTQPQEWWGGRRGDRGSCLTDRGA